MTKIKMVPVEEAVYILYELVQSHPDDADEFVISPEELRAIRIIHGVVDLSLQAQVYNSVMR